MLYQVVPAGQPIEPLEKIRPSHLNVQCVKIASIAFEIQRQDDTNEKSIIAEQKRISRTFVPFVTSPSPGITYSGVFFTGDRPNWILASNKSGVQIYPSGHNVVHAFTACSLWESRGDFLLYTEEVRSDVIVSFNVIHLCVD
jgi:cleavage and polyadenylation specificity factor subunit 1